MLAKEYFAKYNERLHDDFIKSLCDMYHEMFYESYRIISSRGLDTAIAIAGVFSEQNDKWNSVCDRFIKKYGYEGPHKDTFKSWIVNDIQKLKETWI